MQRILLSGAVVISLALSAPTSATEPSPPRVARIVSEAGAMQPQAAVGADGHVFVAYGVGDNVRCVASRDGGATFEEPSTVGSPGVLALGMRRGPRVAATEDAVVIAAIGGSVGKGQDGDVWAWRSTDTGKSWSGAVRINTVEGSAREGLHALAAGPEGMLYCAWLDLRNDRMELFGAASRDGGATWEPDRLIYRSIEKSICECCHPSLAFASDGTLFIMWRNQLAGARDMYLTRSNDGGQTFAPAEKLGEGTWMLDACPMDGGSIAVGPNGEVETIWMRDGQTFLAAPGESERLLGRGVQGWAASGETGIFAVWLNGRPGELLAALPGTSQPIRLARSAQDPVVASAIGGQGPVIAVWEAGVGLFATRLDRNP